jgi:asparagine synthase (glutamine-hydrolysing)
MPGINGIISLKSPAECGDLVLSMTRCMLHENSYVSGTHFVPDMGLYAGWVAHDTSFAASQVFLNERKDIALIFAGECFVDDETRATLKHERHRLETDGDLLVHLYEEEGDQFFENLNGLFSGLLIDTRRRKAVLFNDRYGFERIYYCEVNGDFYFASEAKALLRILPDLRAFDEEGIAQFLAFGCTLEWRTLFRRIRLLPSASAWSFEDRKCYKRKYFSPVDWESQSILRPGAFEIEFERTFKRTLPAYFEADSRLAISLTAGLDTRMIMACLPEGIEKPVCYTFSGDEDTLDACLSKQVASACGLEHQIFRIGPDFFSDFASHADRTVFVTDGCLGVLGTHEIYLNSQARELSPVRLTGVFGGEILRGVSMLKPPRLSRCLFDPDFGNHLNSLEPAAAGNGLHPVSFAAFHEIPQKRFALPAASRSQVTFRTPYLDNDIVALSYRVPKALRMSAEPALALVKRNSARLTRIPTDMGEMGRGNRLVATARRTAAAVARKLECVHKEGFPPWLSAFDRISYRIGPSIKGFKQHKFLHYRSWFQRELAPYVADVLNSPASRRSSFWNSHFIKQMAAEHIAGRANYMNEIGAVITIEAIERILFRDLPRTLHRPAQRRAENSYPIA